MDQPTRALIRQHTFACLVLANHALHMAHEAYHRVHIENAIDPTPMGNDLIAAARARLKLAWWIRDVAQVACATCDDLPPHPFFTEGLWQ